VLMRGRTTIVITHSLHLAAKADHVVVVDDGRVVEEGSPEELLAATGPFRLLAAEQGLVAASPPVRAPVHDPALPSLATLLEADIGALIQWFPVDLWLPVLGDTGEELWAELGRAGVRMGSGEEPTVLHYKPRRRAVLRVGRRVVKVYGKPAEFARGALGLREA